MTTMRWPTLSLLDVAAAVLAVTAAGCCPDDPPEIRRVVHEGTISGTDLAEVRDSAETPADRCAEACRLLSSKEGDSNVDEVIECTATAASMTPADPWDPAHTSVDVSCYAKHVDEAFCTGRRPQGHRELDTPVRSAGAWLAVHAHLERASITAFRELAAWLRAREAPTDLVERCEAAAADEVVHAATLTALAERAGATVPEPLADPPATDLLAVALHNAVEGCVSEAFAAVVALHQAERAEDPELRALFATIAADELRHGQLAWDLHTWLMGQLDDLGRARVAAAQRQALASLAATAERNAAATPSAFGWPPPSHAAAMADRFAELLAA